MVTCEVTQRANVPPAADGQEVQVLEIFLIPFEVWEQHKPSLWVRVLEYDTILFLPALQDVVYPLEGGGGGREEERREGEEGERREA